jgi:hypothetical protein
VMPGHRKIEPLHGEAIDRRPRPRRFRDQPRPGPAPAGECFTPRNGQGAGNELSSVRRKRQMMPCELDRGRARTAAECLRVTAAQT